jgi:hypothetical protein
MRKEIWKEEIINEVLGNNLKHPFSKELIFKQFQRDIKQQFKEEPFIDAVYITDEMFCVLNGRIVILRFSDDCISINMFTDEMMEKIREIVLNFEEKYGLKDALKATLYGLFRHNSKTLEGEEVEGALELINLYAKVEHDLKERKKLSEEVIKARMKKEFPEGPLLKFLTLYFEEE